MSMKLQVLCVIENKLNLMMMETLQLDRVPPNATQDDICFLILDGISTGKISSIHITQLEAINALKIMHDLECTNEIKLWKELEPTNEIFKDYPF